MKATIDTSQMQLITDIAREIVSQTAPEELPLFKATSTAYFRDPEKVSRDRAVTDEMLGFGAEFATALAPVALTITAEVIRFLIEELRKSLKQESTSAINDAVKKLFRKFRGAGQSAGKAPALTSEQLAEVHRRAYEKARQLKVPKAQAGQLADSLVAALTLAPV